MSELEELFAALATLDRDRHSDASAGQAYAGDLSFFEAVRLLDCVLARAGGGSRPPTGTERTSPSREPFRLSHRPSLRYTASMLAGFEEHGWRGLPELEVACFGLLGPDGPMPMFLTEWVLDRLRREDAVFRRFLDVFHHRLLGLHYRAWCESRPAAQAERGAADRATARIGALIGVEADDPTSDRLDSVKHYYADRFASRLRNPDGLRAIVEQMFAVPVAVVEFIGRWRTLRATDSDAHALGADGARLGATMLGDRVYDCMQTVRVSIGPLGLGDYGSLLPGQGRLERLTRVMRDYAGPELEIEVELVLARDEAPPLRLDGSCALGHTTHVATAPLDHDSHNVLNPVL